MNRETWLESAVRAMKPWFSELGVKVPQVYVSVSWPNTGAKGKAIGLCSYHGDDGNPQLMINPKLTDPVQVLGTLLHELVHASLPVGTKHGKGFKNLATDLGLTGKMTATYETPELGQVLSSMAARLGPYPHSRLTAEGSKKQSTRMIKVTCPLDGYTLRTTAKWLEIGVPTCPCGTGMEF